MAVDEYVVAMGADGYEFCGSYPKFGRFCDCDEAQDAGVP